MLAQGFLDSSGAESSDALADRECPLQAVLAFAAGAVSEAGPADFFQGSRFLQRRAEVAGDGQPDWSWTVIVPRRCWVSAATPLALVMVWA